MSLILSTLPSFNLLVASSLATETDPLRLLTSLNINRQVRPISLRIWVNDQSVATYSTDTAGRISIGAFPTHAPSPLLFRKLRVSNAAHEVVLQTDLR